MVWKTTDGDRRKEPRHKIRIEVNVIIPKTSLRATVANISGGGMEIQLPTAINPGTKVIVSMQLQEEFVFHATVVWTLGDFVDERWIYRVGIKTEAISFKDFVATTTLEKAELVQEILPQIKAKGSGETLDNQASA